jgi:deoxyxylulose-5-phosphate synthase
LVFVEEGVREGGFGEYAAALALRRDCSGMIRTLAAEGNFSALGTRRELLRRNGLDGEGIARRIAEWWVQGETGAEAAGETTVEREKFALHPFL